MSCICLMGRQGSICSVKALPPISVMDHLLLFERSWMSRWKSSVLHEGEGNIRSVKWRGHLIAWANNMGVKIFDIISKQRITNVPRDDISLRPDMYPCSLCWKDTLTHSFFIRVDDGKRLKLNHPACLNFPYCSCTRGISCKITVNTVSKQKENSVTPAESCICSVKERHASEMRDLPSRYVEIGLPNLLAFFTRLFHGLYGMARNISYGKIISLKWSFCVSQFETEFYVSGLAPLCDQLVVLSYVKEVSEKTEREYCARPRLDIIQPLSETCEEISSDALTVRGFQENECRDYHLEYSEGESLFYIVSPRDVVVAKERDQDDHIDWLLEKKKYEEALMAAEISQRNIKRHKILDIGLAYINHLVAKGEYDIAARKCQKILGKNAALWEYEVYKFKEIGQLKAISPYLPRGDPVLKPLIYEMILHEFLESDYEGFATLIREWPGNLYNNSVIVQAVRDHLKKDSQNKTLLKTLAELYTYDKNYGNALEIYLTLRHKDVFQLIHKHNLFSSIKDKIVLLMDFDSEKAVDMLLDNEDKISIKKVVEELEDRPELQHVYLHKLFKRDHHKGQRYHEKQISLYAEYDRPNLLPFLRDSTHCPLEKALEICQQRNFVEETVYLLSRMGNSRSALKMIMEELHDVDKAIEFAKEQDDGELWEDLILYSIDKPPFITGLLNNIGTHVDPILLIHRIKEGMEIPNLRDSLVKILQDYNLQTSTTLLSNNSEFVIRAMEPTVLALLHLKMSFYYIMMKLLSWKQKDFSGRAKR
ncbi:hypothetical protein HPG69_013457 [Diceros bicornis minor]|uniref:EGF-like domain-containing protein n=1 Tax=Diceros bicornis minor TaxID=77932 RepID=A0A7J7E988_DICBM|nr:hypothetical protein HPG69_013457 [Diceros bicornis minor]